MRSAHTTSPTAARPDTNLQQPTRCTLSVNVTGGVGTYQNTTTAIISNESGSGFTSNTATLTSVTPVCYAPPSGMVSWWPGEGNANDIVGSNNGTTQGATFAPGEVGQAFSVTGGTYVDIPNAASLNPTTAITVDAWVNGSALDVYQAIVKKADANAGYSLEMSSSKFAFYAWTSGGFAGVASVTSPAINTWYHVAGTYDSSTSTLAIYVNGVLESSVPLSGTLSPASHDLNFGRDPANLGDPGRYWNGFIDEVELFSRALNADEIKGIYQAGSAGKCKSNATISKSFAPSSIPVGGTSTLSFTINNPNAEVNLSGVAFTDGLPSGLTVASSPAATNSCGGTFTTTPGSGSVSLTGGTVAANGSCTLSVPVTSSTPGAANNTTGPISTNEVPTGGGTASASITVATPPTIVKSFGASSIPLNGSTSLSFTITNPSANTTSLTGVGFTDNLPAGLVVATPNNGLNNVCGGTASAVAGSTSVSLSSATLTTNTSCTFSVNVTGITAGQQNNSVSVTSNEGGTGNTATASILVVAPPSISKAFSPATVPLGNDSAVTFMITNPNSFAGGGLSSIAFSDNLPSGLTVVSAPGESNSCNGTVSADANSGIISLSGGVIVAGGSSRFRSTSRAQARPPTPTRLAPSVRRKAVLVPPATPRCSRW